LRNAPKKHTACLMVGCVGMAPTSPLSQHRTGPCAVKSGSYVIIEISTHFFNPDSLCSK